MRRKLVIAIIGTGRESEPAVSTARKMGQLVAQQGWVTVTGGRNAGVMRAACTGAKEAGGHTIGILPNRDANIAADVEVAIVTDTGEARNNIIVLSADVVVACGVEDAGTASEVALALKAGKPVILLGVDATAKEFFLSIGDGNVQIADTPEEAMKNVGRLDI